MLKKIIKEINLSGLKKKFKNKKIVLCHGAFDILHLGHINQFKNAKKLGDILIVSITEDKFINKSPTSPYFKSNVRAEMLSNLEIIDFVTVSNSSSAINVLKFLKPNFYVKGEEYKRYDNIGNLNEEIKFCKQNKILIKFIGKKIYSSSSIIKNNFLINNHAEKNLRKKIFENKIEINLFDEALDQIKKLKILVLGDIIIDLYTYVNSRSISSKSGTISYLMNKREFMMGGALATYKYISQFNKDVKFISLGNKNYLRKKNININNNKNITLFGSKKNKNVIKEKYILKNENKTFRKIFAVNNVEKIKLSETDKLKYSNYINKEIPKYDIVITQDFGHGAIDNNLSKIIQKKSKLLSLNCQTNSINFGNNIIGKKFNKANILSLDKVELEMHQQQKTQNLNSEVKNIHKKMKCKKTYLTCGKDPAILYNKNKIIDCETINQRALDAVGAGDIFHSTVSIFEKTQLNNFYKILIAQIAGGIASNIVGNARPPKINEIRRNLDYFISDK